MFKIFIAKLFGDNGSINGFKAVKYKNKFYFDAGFEGYGVDPNWFGWVEATNNTENFLETIIHADRMDEIMERRFKGI